MHAPGSTHLSIASAVVSVMGGELPRKKKREHVCDKCGHDIIGVPLTMGRRFYCVDGCAKTTRQAAWDDALASLLEEDL